MPENPQYRQPEFLGAEHVPIHRIRCAVHGFIRYSSAERKIIDHPNFQRLRYIRQLALTELVYPGATHTRFEHSLGVMEMATRMFDRLAMEQGGLMADIFASVEKLREQPLAGARQVCRLAGLLHDVGHCCFSHAAEHVIHKGSSHESFTIELLHQHTAALDQLFFPGCTELTVELIEPRAHIPQIQVLRDIVSGQVDADRADYLLRDSHHCGVEYGLFDYRRLIESLTCWQDDESGDLVIGIKRDGIHIFESLIWSRRQMHTQVYFHRLRRIYDIYLRRYFSAFDPAEFSSTESKLKWTDVKALDRLMHDAEDANAAGHDWAKRIIRRDHHRVVFALDEGDGPSAVKTAKKVLNKIREEFKQYDFIEDLPDKPYLIHKVAKDNDQEAQGIDFPVLDRGKKTSLAKRSQIVKDLRPTFRVGYIFANVTDKSERGKVAARCDQLGHELGG